MGQLHRASRMNRLRSLQPGRQRGVAIITALLLTTLAITIVASLFWQQQVQVRSMENQRLHLQTRWILRGGLDWARLILRQDGFDKGGLTTLDGVWAAPLAETRLDDYVERERVEGENFDATLSGQIADAQSRYNLTNLATAKVINTDQVLVFQRLLTNLQLSPTLAQAVAQAVAKGQTAATSTDSSSSSSSSTTSSTSSTSQSGSSTPMEFVEVDDLLSVAGFSPTLLQKLRDYVVVLPEATALNVNTAPAELLASVVNFSVAEANTLVAARKRAYFNNLGEFSNSLNGVTLIGSTSTVKLDVKSNYFLVSTRVRLDRAALDAQALVLRRSVQGMPTTVVSIREN
jgi:general secretion pathway protein K